MRCTRHIGRLFILGTLLFAANLNGQQNNTQFLMHSIPQSNFLNPAEKPLCKLYIGLPLLGTMDISYSNTSFTLNELTADGQLQLYDVYDQLPGRSIISARFMTYPLSLGYRYKDNYFTFSIADRVSAYVSFTKDLIGLPLNGNYQYIDNTAHYHPRVDASYFREYSAGWAFDIDDYNAVGIKGKMLFGKANMGMGKSDISFSTDPITYGLSLTGDVTMNASFPMELVLDADSAINSVNISNIDPVSFLLNRNNMGFGIDVGYINNWLEDFTFSASIIDLGAFLWRSDLNNLNLDADVVFDGVQANLDFFMDSIQINNVLVQYRDSLLQQFSYDVTHESYLTYLPAQVYLGAEYHWLENVDLGLVVRNVIESRTVKSSATASINAHYKNILHGTLSWSYINRSFLNFGAGISYTGRGFQFYMVSDNIYGFIRPVNTRMINLRFGMNLIFGCSAFERERSTGGHFMVPCPKYKPSRVIKSKKPY